MDLGRILRKIWGRKFKYESVEATYSDDGSFQLITEHNGRKVVYYSSRPYSTQVTGMDVSKRVPGYQTLTIEGNAPKLLIETNGGEDIVGVLYDEEPGITVISTLQHGKPKLSVLKQAQTIICDSPLMDSHNGPNFVANMEHGFLAEARRLNVGYYEKMVQQRVVQPYLP